MNNTLPQIPNHSYNQLEPYIEWFKQLSKTISENKDEFSIAGLPDHQNNTIFSYFKDNNITPEQQLIIVILLLDIYFPELFLPFIKVYSQENTRGVIGGKLCEYSKLYEPSVQTAIFLLAGGCPKKRLSYSFLLEESNNTLFADGIIDYKYEKQTGLRAPVVLNEDFRLSLIGKNAPRLDTGDNFPARLSSTQIKFEEVILSETTLTALAPLFRYLKVRKEISSDAELSKAVRPCFMTVFSGFPGTGKTVAAKTIGKMYGLPTYSLDLSRVVSKYIGEFEKAIDKVFTRFSGKDCILFIDEADSIFTKRLENIAEAKDKYINQEMAYLLQRIEDYNGVIILASNVANFKQQVDNAMIRRIRSIVQFPFPLSNERKQLWENAFPKQLKYEDKLFEKLADSFQFTGASIYSIVSEVVLYVIAEKVDVISFEVIKPFLEADFRKRDITMRPCQDNENPQTVMGQRVGKQAMSTGKRM